MGLGQVCRGLYYPIFNRRKGAVALLFYDSVAGSSDSGINSDYKQLLKLLGYF